MKKIIFMVFVGLMLSGSCFATDLKLRLTATTLSNGVSGVYFANDNGAGNNATNYIIGTGHAQGSKAYATGNFVSDIYTKDNANDKFVSGDLVTEVAYTSAGLDGWGDVN